MAGVLGSSVEQRKQRAHLILEEAKKKDHSNREEGIRKLAEKFLPFVDQLIKLANQKIEDRVTHGTVDSAFKRFVNAGLPIIIPLQRSLDVKGLSNPMSALTAESDPYAIDELLLTQTQVQVIPQPVAAQGSSRRKNNPQLNINDDAGEDGAGLVKIAGIADQFEVFQSLIKPKKIVLKGTDGISYPIMCKPKDDLRRDSRMMEICTLINKLLWQDPFCRQRRLSIRTYAVVPLNEEVGVLEWVPNLSGLRPILMKLYKDRDKGLSSRELRDMYQNTSMTELARFQAVLKRFPPVFHHWFLSSFPSPMAWYEARVKYVRSCAVMSMVGTMVALGDRHAENVNIDTTSGEIVHVDFNCLFNKGLELKLPEKMPFRLTHNMTDAMGVTGVEGPFRLVCEATMDLLRRNKTTLLSVLETFVYDPLVEWTPKFRDVESLNMDAVRHLKDIANVLDGIVRLMQNEGGNSNNNSIPLNVQGQVDHLISVATSPEILASAYIGWGSYY